jgi:murein L,D-transpeptidase YafK
MRKLLVLLLVVGGLAVWGGVRFRSPWSAPSPGDTAAAADRATALLRAELGALGLEIGDPVFLRVFKDTQEVEVWMQGEPGAEWTFYKTYRTCGPVAEPGPRPTVSDGGAPEGFYYAAPRHLSSRGGVLGLELGNPNAYDRHHRHNKRPGRLEGGCAPSGSYALGDQGIAEIVTLARAAWERGQPFFRIHCYPFRMTDARMNRELAARAPWIDFWADLKEGYDFFDVLRRPPDTVVQNGDYVFR